MLMGFFFKFSFCCCWLFFFNIKKRFLFFSLVIGNPIQSSNIGTKNLGIACPILVPQHPLLRPVASVCLSVLDLLHRALHNQLFRRCNWLFDLFNGLGNTAILSSARNLRRITHRRYSSTLPGALFVREKSRKSCFKRCQRYRWCPC